MLMAAHPRPSNPRTDDSGIDGARRTHGWRAARARSCGRSTRPSTLCVALASPSLVALVALSIFMGLNGGRCDAKLFDRCELAQVLRHKHGLGVQEVANWVCIAQHSSGFNTAAQATGLAGGSHGLFQISDVYWCSPPGKGFGCNVPCRKLRDDDLTDDLACARIIHAEHARISGNGYTAWNAYQQYCGNGAQSYIAGCFANERLPAATHTHATYAANPHSHAVITSNSIPDYSPRKRGKVYARCELALELYTKHKMPMEEIPTWICIAQHESNFDTSAIGRLNADGSADHGLFQISDLYWCSHSGYGKACGLTCNKLLDNDITDDVRCIRRIHKEHTGISGDGFTAWSVYEPYCRNQRYEHVASCFKHEKPTNQLTTYQSQHTHHTPPQQTHTNMHSSAYPASQKILSNPFLKHVSTPIQSTQFTHHTTDIHKPHKGKVYNRCELSHELYFKHKFPMQDIATWVCIAQYESSFDTSAVGRLNGDGSLDHGLFQISDLYWCSHDLRGGKACNIPCDKLLDSDISDDVRCIKNIFEEHTRISGDGFTAWTVYNRNCRNQTIAHVHSCFDSKELSKDYEAQTSNRISSISTPAKNVGKGKHYKKCELAQELYFKYKMPMKDIPTWICIAQYESSFNTAAVGRLNTDGSLDHGLFQISDLYWCSHDHRGGKACNIPCDKLLDNDITDDIHCVKTIFEEHTRISGDGFTAWTVYNKNCRNQRIEQVSSCFDSKDLAQGQEIAPTYGTSSISTPAKSVGKGKHYKKCELAQELYFKHKMPMKDIPTWVCIAQYESSFNTAAVGRLNTDGSLDHGLFQISDLYWCSHDHRGGKACNIPCDKLLDNDITDDIHCVKTIFEEHTRISGDGFTAWTVYNRNCRNQRIEQVSSCFDSKDLAQGQEIAPTYGTSSISTPAKSVGKGKHYKKCELAQELYFKHKMPMKDIPTWVCIAQYESSFNTAAVGRLNTDGSLDHGLFQISDLYWCSHDHRGGKACNIPCDKLLDNDITDDIHCVKTIFEEHTRISGDGFTAWTVYNRNCRNQRIEQVSSCFDSKDLAQGQEIAPTYGTSSISTPAKSVGKGKHYKKCELAQELYFKHKMPMKDIPTWVCIAQYESSFNTAAVGRLNTDGSLDHGLFQISDLYWCSHDHRGGKACNIPCDKLLDNDITDDIHCVKTIFEEHTRISGDGFTAWTVYNRNCRNQRIEQVSSCFDSKDLAQGQEIAPTYGTSSISTPAKSVGKGKHYKKCELAQELYFKHKMPMKDIPTWVCIAQYESSFNTAAVGRLNTDGSLDHGLFQISDLYWCSHDHRGGKACNIPCDKLLDNDITDDIHCVKTIFEEHTRISGDGFTAWTVYNRNCRNQQLKQIESCFDSKELTKDQSSADSYIRKQAHNEPTYTSYRDDTRPKGSLNHPFSKNPFLNRINATTNVVAKPFLSSFSNTVDLKAPSNQRPSVGVKDHVAAPKSTQEYTRNPFLSKYTNSLSNIETIVVGPKPAPTPTATVVPQHGIAASKGSPTQYGNNPFLQKISAASLNSNGMLPSGQMIKPYLDSASFRVTTITESFKKPIAATATAEIAGMRLSSSTYLKAPTTTRSSAISLTTTTRKPTTTSRETVSTRRTTSTWRDTSTTSRPMTTLREPTTTRRSTATLRVSTTTSRSTTTFRVPTTTRRSTTLKVPSTTRRSTTTLRPPSTTSRPMTTLREPTTTRRSTTTLRVPTTTRRSTTTLRIPPTTRRSTTTLRVPTTTRRSTTTLRPPSTTRKSTSALREPTTTKRSTVTPKGTTTTRRPTTAAKRTTSTRAPTTTIKRSTTTTKRPTTTTKKSTTTTKRSTTTTKRSTTTTRGSTKPTATKLRSTTPRREASITGRAPHTKSPTKRPPTTAWDLRRNTPTNATKTLRTSVSPTKRLSTAKPIASQIKSTTPTKRPPPTAPTTRTTPRTRTTTAAHRAAAIQRTTAWPGSWANAGAKTPTPTSTSTSAISRATTAYGTTTNTTAGSWRTTKTTRTTTAARPTKQTTGTTTTRKPTSKLTTTPTRAINTTIRPTHNAQRTATRATTSRPTATLNHELAAKYKKDPFSHPFFAKFNERFESIKRTARTPTTNSHKQQ